MDAAALLLLISGVGVDFGWQPMPDGSPRYEYIVQVEPELIDTLANGQTIPIVAEAPEHIQPIGRVRIVVGRDDLPRQQLVTRLKPPSDSVAAAGAAKSADVEWPPDRLRRTSAYQPAADERYGQPPSPPATTWNGDGPAAPPPTSGNDGVLPTGQQLFDGAADVQAAAEQAWNGGVESASAAASDALNSVSNEVRQSAEQSVKQGMEAVDKSLQDAAGSLGDRTRGLLNELTGSASPPQSGASTDPRPIAATSATPNPASTQWNGSPAGAAPTAVAGAPTDGHAWNEPQGPSAVGSPPAAAAPTNAHVWNEPQGASAVGSPPAVPPLAVGNTPWNGDGATVADPRAAAAASPPTPNPFANAVDPRLHSGSQAVNASNRSTAGAVAPTPLETAPPSVGPPPQWGSNNPLVVPPAVGVSPAGQPPAPYRDLDAAPIAGPAFPKVDELMLRQPSNRPLEGVDPHDQKAADPASLASAAPPAITPTSAALPNAAKKPDAGGQGWAPPLAAEAVADANKAVPRNNAAAVIAAWVLLTGSIAGNLYLFWSYLDVRQKYRSLVRKTARAVGSRFSAA